MGARGRRTRYSSWNNCRTSGCTEPERNINSRGAGFRATVERMRRVIYEVACSLDGYIARLDHSCDWLPNDEQDYGLKDFYARLDTALIGRKRRRAVGQQQSSGTYWNAEIEARQGHLAGRRIKPRTDALRVPFSRRSFAGDRACFAGRRNSAVSPVYRRNAAQTHRGKGISGRSGPAKVRARFLKYPVNQPEPRGRAS